jgi:ABC-type Na+ transport system ATPase subunit NatA
MSNNFDRQKMLETLVNPDVSMILAELENGEKDSNYLVEKLGITTKEIEERLAYAIKYNFVVMVNHGDKIIFKADMEKLNKIMENEENFANIVDGLTELDQFLN